MPNVLDAAPIDMLARRIAGKIPDANAAARFARLGFDELLYDPRNFRPATPAEIAAAEDWARREHNLGREIVVFACNRSAAARLRRIAEALTETCAEISDIATLPRDQIKPRDITMVQAAREFIAKIDRANFETIEGKARLFARERKHRLAEANAALALYPRAEIYSSPGRVWRRVTSVAELWDVGLEFKNCLARSSRHISAYARRLRDGDAQFWVLRDQNGAGLMVVMICMLEKRIAEARGPRNAIIPADHPDLLQLAKVKGWDGGGGGAGAALALRGLMASELILDTLLSPPRGRLRRR